MYCTDAGVECAALDRVLSVNVVMKRKLTVCSHVQFNSAAVTAGLVSDWTVVLVSSRGDYMY